MPHRLRAVRPRPLTVHLDSPVEQEFWRQYFNASLGDIENAMAEVGAADIAIMDWLADHRGGPRGSLTKVSG